MRRLITAGFVVAVGLTGCSHTSAPSAQPQPAVTQSVLPFADLDAPYDVSVDAAGNVFVTDIEGGRNGSNRVIELPAGSKTQQVLPYSRATVLSNASGEVSVIDDRQRPSRLVKLGLDAGQQSVLPLPDLGMRGKIVAVDDSRNVYGVSGGGEVPGGGCCVPVHVVKSGPEANAPETLPFESINLLGGMTIDSTGNLFVGDDSRKRVLKLAPGASGPVEMPFGNLRSVIDVAVDSSGAVYVVDGQQNQVLKLTPGSTAPTVLPFNGLLRPVSVAVDGSGDVFVVDAGHKRVVELKGPATAPSVTTPTSAPLTQQPCDVLTPALAEQFVGDDAERQFSYNVDPPVRVGDNSCLYTGATREIEVMIYPRPTNPTAPVNHFNVISPGNRVVELGFEAYWFGPGESIVAVKDGLLIQVKVANIKGSWTAQDRADDVDLANLVVPQVG